MDGVIIDSAQLKIDALKMTFKELNIFEAELTDNKILACHPHDLLKNYYNDLHEAVLCHEYIHSSLRKELNLFLSLEDIQYIKNKTLGIALFTAQPKHRVEDMLGRQLLRNFDVIITEGEVLPFTKPSPYGIELILKQQPHWTKSETYLIGDTIEDIEAGRLAGINTIAASWGFTSNEDLIKFGCDCIFDSPSDILNFVEQSMEKKCINYMN